MIAQRCAVERVFKKQGLKFRNFEILNKDEESLGIIFTYFMLETILLGKLMKLNPFDQPAVESIKKETKFVCSCGLYGACAGRCGAKATSIQKQI